MGILAVQAAVGVENDFNNVGREVDSRLCDELRDVLGGLQSISSLSHVHEISGLTVQSTSSCCGASNPLVENSLISCLKPTQSGPSG